MLKLLPVIVVVTLMISVLVYIRFFKISQPITTPQASSVSYTPTTGATDKERIQALEDAVMTIAKQINKMQTSGGSGTSSDLENRVKFLEDQVAILQRQQSNGEVTGTTITPVPTASPVSQKQPALYIPLGTGGSSTGSDWTTINTYKITLDPADYPGYSSMQLELSLRVYQGNGKAFARLINSDDGLAVLLSEVSTTFGDYTWVTSSPFTLSSGKKNYKVQLKSLTGYEAGIQNARIKVNF
ncbi:MAG: hypothetical protein M1142_03975 [Patescibacteria group bacterium]|nr:hypothetical protein [Patescibacteria group bacterium]